MSVMKHNFAYKISDIRNDEILFLTCSNTHTQRHCLSTEFFKLSFLLKNVESYYWLPKMMSTKIF